MPFRPAQCCERIPTDLIRRVASLSHRLTTAEEVAEAACYLAGPQAASITGHTLVLDGGLLSV